MFLKKKKYFLVLGILCVSTVLGIFIYKNNLKFGTLLSINSIKNESTLPIPVPKPVPTPTHNDMNEKAIVSEPEPEPEPEIENFPFIEKDFPLCSMDRNTEIISNNKKLKKELTYCLEYLDMNFSSGDIESYQINDYYTVVSFNSEVYEVYFRDDSEKNIFTIKSKDFITPTCISDKKTKICLPFLSISRSNIDIEKHIISGIGVRVYYARDQISDSFRYRLPDNFGLSQHELILLIDENKFQSMWNTGT